MIRRIIFVVVVTACMLIINARLDHDRTFNPPDCHTMNNLVCGTRQR